MKVKTFIILLILTIVIPAAVFKIKYANSAKNVETYSSYGIKIKESSDDINIIHKDKSDMELNIEFNNNNNETPKEFKLFIFVNDIQVKFNYNEESYESFSFTMDSEVKNYNIKIPKEYINNKKSKLTITALKQEDVNKYNDAATKTYLLTTENLEDTPLSYDKQYDNYVLQKLDYNFMGIILNDDISSMSDYNGENYNNKEFKTKVKNNSTNLAVRIPNLIANKEYIIYFTIGDKQIKLKDDIRYIKFMPKETSSYYFSLKLDNIEIGEEEYIYCHLVSDINNEDSYVNNVISNKVILYK